MNISFSRVLGFAWMAVAMWMALWERNVAMAALALCGAAFAEIAWMKDRLGI